ncbi:MAG: RNB domain-containing ribonuclease [Verrucomicrobiota bacterium]
MLHDAHELAQKIRRLRFKNGSLALDFPETKIRLDDQGRVLRIEKIENDVSHQLIEEYMLLANEAVASRLMSENQKAIYRVHEEPDERRLNEYREDVLSHHIPCGNLTKRPEVSKLLQKLDTIPIGAALKIGFLRSLMRARYAVDAARALRAGQGQIHALHVAHPPLRRPRRPSRAVSSEPRPDAFAQGNRRTHLRHRTQFRRRRARQQGREDVCVPESAIGDAETAGVSRAGD